MSVRMRHTKGHTRNRRSHHGLEEPRLSTCEKCGASHERHKVCMECGTYRGRMVVDVEAIEAKKEARRTEKLRRLGEEEKEEKDGDDEAGAADAPLDASSLSKK